MEFYSPLRYPGGKGRLSTLMKDIFIDNEICGATYIEPYAGGAAVALTLLIEEYVLDIIINDIDFAIYSFWSCILNNTEWFLKKLQDTHITLDEWYTQKEIFDHPNDYSPKEVGFSAFFLNRTNRSGILRGGIIGGKQQAGKYKIDARFNKKALQKRIIKIANHKNRIKLFNLDAKELVQRICKNINQNVFFYFDPPYYNKGDILYTNHYKPNDHADLADIIKNLNYSWIVTYDDVPAIANLYFGVPSIRYSLKYSAYTDRPTASEVMFYNGISLPGYISKMKMPYFSLQTITDLRSEAFSNLV